MNEVFILLPLFNPLIGDYIKRESRGLAVSYINVSMQLGSFIAVFFFMAVAQYTSVTVAYDMLCMTFVLMGIWLFVFIDDIKDMSLYDTSN
jgi:sugar phosphate permease